MVRVWSMCMGLVDAIRHFVRAPAFKFIIIIVLILALSIPLLFVSFAEAQKYYAVFGATFVPMLAVLLLVMNGKRAWVGELRNRVWSMIGLGAALVLFGWFAWIEIDRRF